MSSKKLRLDMDSMLEASSPPSTSSPFRGKYTRPLGGRGGSMTGGSRYTPYSISRDRPSARRSVPLIRATRDEEDGGGTSSSSVDLNTSSGFGGNSSSTAQKIIETLASMSTPVLNAGRVRIDSIKAMKPMSLGSVAENRGSMLTPTSRFSGPPKTSSPLMLPKSLTGVRGASLGSDHLNWSLRSIGMQPKMIDSGTNTEESFLVSEKKEQAQPPTPTQVVAIVANNSNSVTSIQPENGLRHSAVKRKFHFSEPWSTKDLEKVGRISNEEITEAMNDDESSSSSSSSSDEEDEELSNDVATPALVALQNGEASKQVKSKEPELGSFKFTPILMTSTQSEKEWECPECWARNKPSLSNCACCSTKNPNSKVPEKSTQDKTDSGMKLPSVTKQWKCPTCDVYQKPTNKVCVCCSEKNPNPEDSGPTESNTAVSVADTPASTFKFGFANSGALATATSLPSASTGFSFGSSSQPVASTESGKSFSFGIQPLSSTTTTTSVTKTQSLSSPAAFSFGAPSTTIKPVASASPIKFGLNASTEESKKSEVPSTKKIELWECDVCKHKVKFELHSCEICGSPRPQELDPHYKRAAEKPKAELKFDPVFGGGLKSASSGTSSSAFSSPPTTTPSGGGFGSSSTFGSGTTFSSGNPFGGGGGTFGGSGTFSTAGGLGSGSTFGNAGSSISTPPTTAATGLFSGGSAPPSFSTPGGSTSSQGFQFGSTSPSPSKRKLEEGTEGDPAKKIAASGMANFTFGGTSNIPALKLKETPTPQFPVSPAPASAAAPNNNAGFLEALKNASAAVKASSEKQSNTVTSTSGPPANKTFTFGNTGPVAPASAGGFFNNPNASGFTNTFGSPAGGSFSSPSPSMGLNYSNPPPAVTPVAPVPAAAQFNMTPSFNFGAPVAPASTFNFGSNPSTGAAGGAAAAPFQFAATPSAAGPAIGDRKIKRATRRFK